MYILRLCISNMHSVKHLLLTLEAWAHLKECVPVLFFLFLFCSLIRNDFPGL